MLLTKECVIAAASNEEGCSGSLETLGRTGASCGPDSNGSAKPIDTLRRMMRESYEHARRSPGQGPLVLGGWQTAGPYDPRGLPNIFQALLQQVRAAQRAGELRAGDAPQITALIVSTVLGAADLAQYSPANSERTGIDAQFPPLLLIDLLATKNCY